MFRGLAAVRRASKPVFAYSKYGCFHVQHQGWRDGGRLWAPRAGSCRHGTAISHKARGQCRLQVAGSTVSGSSPRSLLGHARSHRADFIDGSEELCGKCTSGRLSRCLVYSYSSSISHSARGVTTRTPGKHSVGKCFRLPVTKQSALDAIATSMNIPSDGSGSVRLRGAATTGSPVASRNSRRSATCATLNPNLRRASTLRYSARMRSSKQTNALPANTHRKTAAGAP